MELGLVCCCIGYTRALPDEELKTMARRGARQVPLYRKDFDPDIGCHVTIVSCPRCDHAVRYG